MEIAGLSPRGQGGQSSNSELFGASHASAIPILEEAMSTLDVKAERLPEDVAIDEAD
jgi:hypothetical protein